MTANALSGCVASLRSSMQLLDSSINILDSGVSDFPRLATVLQTTRHFELVPQSSLQAAQTALHDEIAPEVSALLARVDTYLDKLERREKSLIAKCELQEGRLSQSQSQRQSTGASKSSGARGFIGAGNSAQVEGTGVSKLEEVKMQQLRQKKERLSYAVGRLELQASQRERQLRKSMAAQ